MKILPLLYIFRFLHQTTTVQKQGNQQYELYIFRFLHQTTTFQLWSYSSCCCISFVSYIKPQLNHQRGMLIIGCISFVSYIKPQPPVVPWHYSQRCISFVSYIKPQRAWQWNTGERRCISFVSYIKPQHTRAWQAVLLVVYLSFPTSNHNCGCGLANIARLYIFRFLHQTTTDPVTGFPSSGCISFVSYIKPQPTSGLTGGVTVVYLSFPTSNHNWRLGILSGSLLYIFRFLHQTTTYVLELLSLLRCISFVSYIKPQLITSFTTTICVVYLSFPTSNHNVIPTR